MLDTFSLRAKQVVFAARFKAGERGAEAIGVDDFLLGLVLEDQGMLGSMFSKLYEGGGTFSNTALSHSPFFSAEVAMPLLTKIENFLSHSKAIGLSTEVPLSPTLERVFDAAKDIQGEFHHAQIEPLHLLAAILKEESSQGVKLLQEFGITQEKIMQKLRGATEN
jgi:ATP-dependent Clp protease ATP-binding subunit ClpA